jgi:HK97 family phage major capsid protein
MNTQPHDLMKLKAAFRGVPVLAEAPDDGFAAIRASMDQHHSAVVGRMGKIENSVDQALRDIGRMQVGGGANGESVNIQALAELFGQSMDTPQAVDVDAYREYRAGFLAYVRRGAHQLAPDIQNVMRIGSGPDGGYWAPTETANMIKSRQHETSQIRPLANVITIGSTAFEQPIDTGELTGGGWVDELESPGESDLGGLKMQKIEVREQFEMPVVTQNLLDDSMFNIEEFLAFKIADQFARRENTAFVSGDGVKKPRGFLDYRTTATTEDDGARAWGKLQYVPVGGASGFPFSSGVGDDPRALFDVVSKMKAMYRQNASWLMNRATASVVRKLRDGEGRFLWQQNLVPDQPPLLLGYPVAEFEDMPDIGAGAFPIAFADLSQGYTIVDRFGVRILRDPFTTKGRVKFYATKRVGGDVTDFDAIKLLKISEA